jgi:hypothetical protein
LSGNLEPGSGFDSSFSEDLENTYMRGGNWIDEEQSLTSALYSALFSAFALSEIGPRTRSTLRKF